MTSLPINEPIITNTNTPKTLSHKESNLLKKELINSRHFLGNDLLIIQQNINNFCPEDVQIDFIALDKQGNLVVIINRFGNCLQSDVWQGLKIANYCSDISKQDIIRIYKEYIGESSTAEESLLNFFDCEAIKDIQFILGSTSQKLIFASFNYDNEAFSMLQWLMDNNIRIQCIKYSLKVYNEQMYLEFDKHISNCNIVDNIITSLLYEEDKEEQYYLEFWSEFIRISKLESKLFNDILPINKSKLKVKVAEPGIFIVFDVLRSECRVKVLIDSGSKEKNKKLFDFLYSEKSMLELRMLKIPDWRRMDDQIVSCMDFGFIVLGLGITDKGFWPHTMKEIGHYLNRIEWGFKEYTNILKKIAHSN